MASTSSGREQGDFDDGIEMALRRLLADPEFLFRKEARAGRTSPPGKPYRISDLELASRLSFFLWSSIPDDELLTLAGQDKLQRSRGAGAAGEAHAGGSAVATRWSSNFAGQWLSLRALQTQAPVVAAFPDFDDNLRQAFRKETELFFEQHGAGRPQHDWICSTPTTPSSTSAWRCITASRMSTAAIPPRDAAAGTRHAPRTARARAVS